MLSLSCYIRKVFFFGAAISSVALLAASSAGASTVDYTFTGNGTALVDGSSYGPANFVITTSGDTANIVNYGTTYYKLSGLNATINSVYGHATLTGVTIVVNDALGFENVNLFNSTFDNGIGLDGSPALLGYTLSSSVDSGMEAGGNLTPTFNGGSFAIQGGSTLEFTALNTLDFKAVAPTPEPASLLLLSSGLSGLVLLRRRFVS